MHFPKDLITAVMSGFIRSGKGEIFWRKTQQGLQGYPFCFDMSMNSKEWSKTFYAFKFFHSIFQVWFVLIDTGHFQSFKKRPWLNIFDDCLTADILCIQVFCQMFQF